MDLLAQKVVDGFLQGLHRSPRLGSSLDFAEHREYLPGDDIRRIDWRLYARTDRLYVKQFEAETNADVAFLLDVSASMRYGSGEASKLDYARLLAASLAYLSAGQKDRVGLYAFDEDVVERVRPSGAHLEKVLLALARAKAERAGGWRLPLARVAKTFLRRGILVAVSDFYDDPKMIAEGLGAFTARGCDVIAFHLLDPAEIRFPFEQAMRFRELESGEVLEASPEKLRRAYLDRARAHIRELGRRFASHGVDYRLMDTGEPLDAALSSYLRFRKRAARLRGIGAGKRALA